VKRLMLLCFAFSIYTLMAWNAIAQSPPKDGLILPGESIAGVKLGSPFSSFEAVFPQHPHADEDMPDSQCGAGRIYHWVDIDHDATGIYAYFKNGNIYQLSVHTPRLALANGIKVEASEERAKSTYPKGRGYVLLHSGSATVGGRDLVYWVDKDTGVAFELYWNRHKKQRLISGIDIFPKGSDYRPESCISPPQQWQERERGSKPEGSRPSTKGR